MNKIELGDTVQDVITKFKGIAIGRCSYITGCDQILIQPISKNLDEKKNSVWVDDTRLKVVKGKKIIIEQTKMKAKNGCDKPAPIK